MILLAPIGTGDYRETDYFTPADSARRHRTRFGPVAVAALLGPVEQALLLLTQEAERQHGPAVIAELESLGVRVRPVQIPIGRSQSDTWDITEAVIAGVTGNPPKDSELILDITHGFRHIPTLMLAAAAYLQAAQNVRLARVVYGAYEARTGDRTPIFELTTFLTLAEASFAARFWHQAGDLKPIATVLNAPHAPALKPLAAALPGLGEALVNGLPLEAGRAARIAYDALGKVKKKPPAPLVRRLTDLIAPNLQRTALPSNSEKAKIVLDLPELDRQLRCTEDAWKVGNYRNALVMLREWTVSRCLLAAGNAGDWLNYSRRHEIEARLNALNHREQVDPGSLTEGQRRIAAYWNALKDARNSLAHAGMSLKDALSGIADHAKKALQFCREHSADGAAWCLAPPGSGKLLLTPLGLAPGVLFTALASRLLAPGDRVIVVTSPEAAAQIPHACELAGWDAATVVRELVADPHLCFGEAQAVVKRLAPSLLTAAEIIVNLTGGTTALQYLVERLAREADSLGLPARRIALIDRRPPEQQRANPFVLGEVMEVEPASVAAAG